MNRRNDNRSPVKPINRGRVMLYAVLLLCGVALMMMVRQCSTPSPFAPREIGHSGGDTIDVAIEYGPSTLYRYDDTLGGLAYDMLRDMARREGLVLKFHPVTSGSMAVGLLQSGAVELLVADTPMTSDYDSLVTFTAPVYLDRQVLVQRADSAGEVEVKSALDLANRRVTVAAGSPMLHRLRNLSAEIGDTIIIDVDSVHGAEQLVMMTGLGEVGMTVVNKRVADRVAASYPQLDAGTRISFTQFQSWMVNGRDTAMRSKIDTLIVRYRDTDGYRQLMKRYGL